VKPSAEKKRRDDVRNALEILLAGGQHSRRALFPTGGRWTEALMARLSKSHAVHKFKRGRGKSTLYESQNSEILEQSLSNETKLTELVWPHADGAAAFQAEELQVELPGLGAPPGQLPALEAFEGATEGEGAPLLPADEDELDSETSDEQGHSSKELLEAILKISMGTMQIMSELSTRLATMEEKMKNLDAKSAAALDILKELL
jgi:hypothetical protein